MKELVQELIKSGAWELVSRKNHIKLRHTSGKILCCAQTESDWRAVKNIQSIARKIEKGVY